MTTNIDAAAVLREPFFTYMAAPTVRNHEALIDAIGTFLDKDTDHVADGREDRVRMSELVQQGIVKQTGHKAERAAIQPDLHVCVEYDADGPRVVVHDGERKIYDEVYRIAAIQPAGVVATVIKKGADRQWMSEALGSLPDGMYSLYLAAPISEATVPDAATRRAQALATAGMELTSTLCALPSRAVGNSDYLKRDQVMDAVVNWRDMFNAAPSIPRPDTQQEAKAEQVTAEQRAAIHAKVLARGDEDHLICPPAAPEAKSEASEQNLALVIARLEQIMANGDAFEVEQLAHEALVCAKALARTAPSSEASAGELPYHETTAGSFAETVLHAMYTSAKRGDSVERMHKAVMDLLAARTPAIAGSIADDAKFRSLLETFYQSGYSFAGRKPIPTAKAALIARIDTIIQGASNA